MRFLLHEALGLQLSSAFTELNTIADVLWLNPHNLAHLWRISSLFFFDTCPDHSDLCVYNKFVKRVRILATALIETPGLNKQTLADEFNCDAWQTTASADATTHLLSKVDSLHRSFSNLRDCKRNHPGPSPALKAREQRPGFVVSFTNATKPNRRVATLVDLRMFSSICTAYE